MKYIEANKNLLSKPQPKLCPTPISDAALQTITDGFENKEYYVVDIEVARELERSRATFIELVRKILNIKLDIK